MSILTPLYRSVFDFTISIAVIHHLSTNERRAKAVNACLKPLAKDGVALLYVWAFEQDQKLKKFGSMHEQDVMVGCTFTFTYTHMKIHTYIHLQITFL